MQVVTLIAFYCSMFCYPFIALGGPKREKEPYQCNSGPFICVGNQSWDESPQPAPPPGATSSPASLRPSKPATSADTTSLDLESMTSPVLNGGSPTPDRESLRIEEENMEENVIRVKRGTVCKLL